MRNYNNQVFAENLMINFRVCNAEAFWKDLIEKGMLEKFGVRFGKPTLQPYGKEVNLIGLAGVCWHFVE
ncbi:MAG TPA: hypothetical protein VFT06_00545 [Flavisolibacter sp.]|nr:hypothetical protein [Flavisolibacter sp.]